ncbi:MAG: peptidylprolyl isomerase [Proteobacteria bacterium]|nr:peptidylprolyl isomerase [Pseudomonadota bacterium]
MVRSLTTLVALIAGLSLLTSVVQASDSLHPRVKLETSLVNIVLELDAERAPISTINFIQYVEDKYYDGTVFHRVMSTFMIQGGGFPADMEKKTDGLRAAIKTESGNGLTNVRGSIAMARTGDPHSANSQFFINLGDNSRLDPQKSAVGGRWGYTVFGYVVDGMDVIDKIALVRTAPQGEHENAPIVPIVIKSMSRKTYD